jgi:hypothetical protein
MRQPHKPLPWTGVQQYEYVDVSHINFSNLGLQGGPGAGGGNDSGAPFVTTYGFTTTRGFSLPSGGKPSQQHWQAEHSRLKQQQQRQQEEQQHHHHQQRRQDEAGSGRVLLDREADSVRSCSSLSTASTLTAGGALAVRVPSSDNTLGWRGMLEASK